MGMDIYLKAAIEEARRGFQAGGIPIGSVLVIDGRIAGRGHNQRIQKSSSVLHAEMDCLENAGRLSATDYKKSILQRMPIWQLLIQSRQSSESHSRPCITAWRQRMDFIIAAVFMGLLVPAGRRSTTIP